MTILFVENHTRFANITAQTFLAAHSVTIVSHISDAKKMLSQSVFDVVLVDYDLDDGKGIELVRWIRERDIRSCVIAVSAHDQGNAALAQAGTDAICGKSNFKDIEKTILENYRQQCD